MQNLCIRPLPTPFLEYKHVGVPLTSSYSADSVTEYPNNLCIGNSTDLFRNNRRYSFIHKLTTYSPTLLLNYVFIVLSYKQYMKRAASDDEGTHPAPNLPSEICLYLIQFLGTLGATRLRDKSNIRAIVRLSACNRSLHSSLEEACKSLLADWPAIDWCNACLVREAIIENGCHGSTVGGGGDCRIQYDSLRLDGSDGLCGDCCRYKCGLCWKGGCGCRNFEELVSCTVCGTVVCTLCFGDPNVYSHHRGMCLQCW